MTTVNKVIAPNAHAYPCRQTCSHDFMHFLLHQVLIKWTL